MQEKDNQCGIIILRNIKELTILTFVEEIYS
ncbi:hypothetical protein ES703_63218 [subsurface metagenome]